MIGRFVALDHPEVGLCPSKEYQPFLLVFFGFGYVASSSRPILWRSEA